MCQGCEPLFSAVEFVVVHDDGVLMAAFRGDSPVGDDPYLLIQLGDEQDQQDHHLGSQ